MGGASGALVRVGGVLLRRFRSSAPGVGHLGRLGRACGAGRLAVEESVRVPERDRLVGTLVLPAPVSEGNRQRGERATPDDLRSPARMATRAEMRNPGAMERTLGRGGGDF